MSGHLKKRGPTVTLVPAGRSSGVLKDFKDLLQAKELLSALVGRELAGKYKGSFLGLGWTLVRPLVMLFIYSVVIGEFLGASRSISQFDIFVLGVGPAEDSNLNKNKIYLVLPYFNNKMDDFSKRLTDLVFKYYPNLDFRLMFSCPASLSNAFSFKDNKLSHMLSRL
jgi:hypothetical protein